MSHIEGLPVAGGVFHIMGPPKAYFEIPRVLDDGVLRELHEGEHVEYYLRVVYRTVMLLHDSEGRLREVIDGIVRLVVQELGKTGDHDKFVWWRRLPEFHFEHTHQKFAGRFRLETTPQLSGEFWDINRLLKEIGAPDMVWAT